MIVSIVPLCPNATDFSLLGDWLVVGWLVADDCYTLPLPKVNGISRHPVVSAPGFVPNLDRTNRSGQNLSGFSKRSLSLPIAPESWSRIK